MGSPRRALARVGAALALAAGLGGGALAALAIDTSCIGVQLESAKARFANLSATDQQALAPVISEIRSLADQVEQSAVAVEATYRAAFDAAIAVQPAAPGATDGQARLGVWRSIQSGDALDSALQDHFRAQARIHEVEVRLATLAARIPSQGDVRELRRMTSVVAGQAGVDRAVVAELRLGSAYGQLLSALVTAQEATNGIDIPASALVGRRFDNKMNDPIAEAAFEASRVLAAIDGHQLGANLLLGHIEEQLRPDGPARRAVMEADTLAARELNAEFGKVHIRTAATERGKKVLAEVARQALESPPSGETRQAKARRTAKEAKLAVQKVKRLLVCKYGPNEPPVCQ